MKALVIGSGDFYCPSDISEHKVIACDGGLDHCRRYGITPDHILGDFDSVSPETYEYFSKFEKTRYPVKKDMTDLELGIELAISLGAEEILITGALSSSRFDHSLCNIGLLKRCLEKNIPSKIINKTNTIMLTDAQRKLVLENDGRYVSLIPLSERVGGITLDGFEYPLENYTLCQGSSLCVSNRIIREKGTIKVKSGILIVIAAKDEE